jgi:hypothetical protein
LVEGILGHPTLYDSPWCDSQALWGSKIMECDRQPCWIS